MKKFWKTVKDNLVTLASFIIVFPIVFLFVLILTSDAKFSDFFTMERVSYLKNRDPRITRDIVVDTTQICNEGGIKTLAENLIEKIAAKRPKWRFIVLIPKDALHGGFPRLAPYDNVKFLNVQLENNKIFLFMRNISNFLTFGLFRDKITQLWFYNNIYIDDKCDLFFDPYAEMNINDFSIPKISLIHDLAYIDLPMTKTIDGYKWIKANSKAILEYSQKIITVSNFSKKRIMEEYKVDDNFVRSIPIRLADRITAESKNFSSAISKKYDLTKGAYL
ncbi:MAG: hypothetical protein LBL99_02490, partial [Holosporaceae bacterium]|nr:hypothetical protein [Holosporaceae bacterium]